MATQNFAGTSQLHHYTSKVSTTLSILSTNLNTSQRTSLSTSLNTQVVKQRQIPNHISQERVNPAGAM